MLPLSANPDFKDITNLTIKNPYYDINGDKLSTDFEIYGTNAIDQAIEMVLCTEPYERIFNLSLSSPLYKILFENMGSINSMIEDVFNQIEYYVPIMIYRDLAEIETDTVNHAIHFKIPYITNDGNFKHTFNRIISK